jgi:alpha-galactosidase/6-phospho-beta-glucosidase family protein
LDLKKDKNKSKNSEENKEKKKEAAVKPKKEKKKIDISSQKIVDLVNSIQWRLGINTKY